MSNERRSMKNSRRSSSSGSLCCFSREFMFALKEREEELMHEIRSWKDLMMAPINPLQAGPAPVMQSTLRAVHVWTCQHQHQGEAFQCNRRDCFPCPFQKRPTGCGSGPLPPRLVKPKETYYRLKGLYRRWMELEQRSKEEIGERIILDRLCSCSRIGGIHLWGCLYLKK
ncbi:hypothetical protein SKAU_G00211300 [Synaphobranchus kaupii]|uniref:SCAN box domain-containing protein n=1 Tax=Synaphobranchus kaupii TaxID=118154 RepID=A0A9Q1F9E0_SYNKA|nr:hypothetical protein SKAU_G00211300 [Synaphobranchus kaupii]